MGGDGACLPGSVLILCGTAFSGHRTGNDEMFFYYLYMVLLVIALVLWAIIAIRDDGGEGDDTESRR